MTADQMASLGRPLDRFLARFAGCFSRSEPREHLATYVRGQLSDLPRKSVEPIADRFNVPRRTLQKFLSRGADLGGWPAEAVGARVQRIVARDHADVEAIGLVDDSGHPKSGDKTAGVQRQYCGRLGKVENCVVTVHLGYATSDLQFRTMLAGDVYLPKHGWQDLGRRREAAIPEGAAYRAKWAIALEQLKAAKANGVALKWVVADEGYGSKPGFRDGVAGLDLLYVVEVPTSTWGWTYWPGPRPQGRPSPVTNLARYAPAMRDQAWRRLVIKDTAKGPLVWEAKACRFWHRRGKGSAGPLWLVRARQPLSGEEKYFLSNAPQDTPLEKILHVAFARAAVEQLFQQEKTDLGLTDFEVRRWDAIHRHLAVTMVSHLFLMRQTLRLRGEKSSDHFRSGPAGERRDGGHARPAAQHPAGLVRAAGRDLVADAGQKRASPPIARQSSPRPPPSRRH
jgi:SRSO17 transposase